MERNGSPRNYLKTNSGISNTIFSKTPPFVPQCQTKSVSNSHIRGNVSNNHQNEKTGHSKNSSTLPKLHLSLISSAKARRICSSNLQPQSPKRLCVDRTISLNKYVSNSRFPPASRLDVQGGFIPGIFPPQNIGVTKTLPTSHIQRRAIRDDLSPVRFKHSPQNFFYSYKLGGSQITRKMEYANTSVFRRLFNCTSECKHTSRSCKNNVTNSTILRVENKFRKIGDCPSKKDNLFRNNVETLGKPEKPTKRKICCYCRKSKSSSQAKKCDSKRLAETSRASKFQQLCCAARPTPPPSTVNVHELTTRPNKDLRITTKCTRGTGLVGSQLLPCNASTLSSSSELFDNRRVGPGLGSTIEQPRPLGHLVDRRTSIALQSERNAGHTTLPGEPRSLNETQLSSHTMRQQNCCRSPTQRRRYEIISSNSNNLPNIEITGPTPNPLQHSPYPRKIQQSCRPFITPSPTSRVALTTGMCGSGDDEMGDTSNRSVRLGDSSRGVQLCIQRLEGHSSPISRRIQCSLELPARVGVSTPVPSPQSSDSPKSINRNISNRCTQVGESILESRPQSSGSSSTANPEEPSETSNRHINGTSTSEGRGHQSRGMEMWGWSSAIDTWNSEQLLLLRNSWRKSTLTTYEVAWKRWLSWTRAENVDPKNPTGSQLARFLADLYLIHKLSYNTILLHKSVVSTLCNAEMSSHLSSHVLVKHILKSISLKNPKSTKSPIWDVSKLISFLSKYTVNINSTFEISRHTAILLLLCSGRRIHDLTLLRTDPDHCIKCDNNIIFWPQFGSKTDSSTFRQSGWKLLSNLDNRNLNPVFWIEKTINLLNERREAAKCFNLFVTVRGVPKPASRIIIAGWVKTLFKEAGIVATPGSVRSAVASKSWLDNHPLDEILAHGNWRSANTFQRFYMREVTRNNPDSENVTQLFNPVN